MAGILGLPPVPHELRESYGADAQQFDDLRVPGPDRFPWSS
jgi:hypothetical protein